MDDFGSFRFFKEQILEEHWCLLSAPTFGLGGSRLWDNDTKISGKERKRSSIQSKIDLYEVCGSLFKLFIIVIISILINLFLNPDLWHLSH